MVLLVSLLGLASVVWLVGLVRLDGLGRVQPPRSHRHEVVRHQHDAIRELLS